MLLKCGIKYLMVTCFILYGTLTYHLVSWIYKQDHNILEKNKITIQSINAASNVRITVKGRTQIGVIMDKRNYLHNLHGLGSNNSYDKEEKDMTNWEVFKTIGKISVFSAYYDDRPNLEVTLVRVIGLMEIQSSDNLVCGFMENNTMFRILAEKYEMCENHEKKYGGFIFNCNIPGHLTVIPQTVYLTSLAHLSAGTGLHIDNMTALQVLHERKAVSNSLVSPIFNKFVMQNDSDASNQIPPVARETSDVITDKNKEKKVNNKNVPDMKIGICIPPMYGNLKLSLLIQFFELSKILGVSNFIIYKMKVSEDVEKLLKFYRIKGEVTLIDWLLPLHVSPHRIWYNGQLLTIQDCLYRNMYKFDYLAFLDIDELIIPRQDEDWPSLLKLLRFSGSENEDTYIAGFSFKSAFFDPNQHLDPSQQLTYLQLLNRNDVISGVRSKVIVQPTQVTEMGIHHVSKTVYYDQSQSVMDVSPTVALIHHYRSCVTQFDSRMICNVPVEDKTILKYADKLTQKYKDVIKDTIHMFTKLPS
ncbi:hypothetical protein CHS0354_005881, partial [Potamilus streckersoni]